MMLLATSSGPLGGGYSLVDLAYIALMVLIVGTVLIMLLRMSKLLITFIALLVAGLFGYEWFYERNEPAVLTPFVEAVVPYLPQFAGVRAKVQETTAAVPKTEQDEWMERWRREGIKSVNATAGDGNLTVNLSTNETTAAPPTIRVEVPSTGAAVEFPVKIDGNGTRQGNGRR